MFRAISIRCRQLMAPSAERGADTDASRYVRGTGGRKVVARPGSALCLSLYRPAQLEQLTRQLPWHRG